ncbi:signal-induced proliferation-associated 1-like protein 1 isoform X1 [Mya arenaria]|uniref:signal-induced proliferation-associated 1-like protein 1 isoform X1 n=1 Tax=Mya arenaria TaxID=6604 RepID=UPI0022DF4D2E|nr:signal-induced proliferation-associated 1-like protein 1 isoform X1 [Mya arenaria]
MSEELIPPFTGPMSKETAQYRAKQAVEYYQRQVKVQNKPDIPKRNNRDRQDVRENNEHVNGYRGSHYENKNVNVDGRHSAQSQGYSYDSDRFVRGGHRATVHGTNGVRPREQQGFNNTVHNHDVQMQNNRTVHSEHRPGSKKRYSRGLHRSNSNLEESLEYMNLENLDASLTTRKGYGSTSSLDNIMNASTSSDSFFQMLENLRPETTDQRSPAPSKLHEVLRGSKTEIKNQNFLRNLEKIANGDVINNRPLSTDEVDEGGQSPRSYKKDRKSRSKSITPDVVGPGVWKRFRGKGDLDIGAKTDSVPDLEVKGDERCRRKAFVHYDSQSIGFDVNKVLTSKKSLTSFNNVSTGASAASGTRESFAADAEAPDIVNDDGDGQNNELVHSCSFFRNEIGGEEERIVGLTQNNANKQSNIDRIQNKSAITMNRSPECCGVTILDCSPTTVGHILPPHSKHKDHVIEYLDSGAYYYRHFFNGQEHQNYFGIDDALGPLAVSIRREKLEERGNNLGKGEAGLYQYRVIIRTSELTVLRGSILEDAIPASGRLSSSRGIPVKDLLEFLAPDVQASCLRQATSGQKTFDQLMKLDEQRIFNTYKIGIMLCKAGQTTEEDMYNNEVGCPAFDEFLSCIGEKVRLKGFEKYRAQLDNKTDSTGTHSVYTTFNNCEIMFHVSTMLPYTPKNTQQLLRKRHIGNDIVTIVFQEPGAPPFTPKCVRSQFQHVFIIVRAHNPCTEKTSYSIAVSRSRDVPPFGPTIPEHAKFYKSREFADFLLAKVINAENAAHHSEKFSAMAVRTRQEYLKDLATNYVTSNSLESASKLSKFVSGKKKEKNRGKLIPDNFALGALVWHVKVEDVSQPSTVVCYLGIAAETLVIVEESTGHVIFTTHCGSVIGWTSQAISLRLYYRQGDCLVLQPLSGDMEELQEIVTRLRAVTPGCETQELTLKRNGLRQLGFHIQAEGIVTDVEQNGFAYVAGLRKGSRLVEICKVASVTLIHDQMVDLLRTSATVKVVVIPPMEDGSPRGVVNLHANHHYSSFPALNAVIQAEFSHHRRQARSSSSSSDAILSPMSPISPHDPSTRDQLPQGSSPWQHKSTEHLHHKYTLHTREFSTNSSSKEGYERAKDASTLREIGARDSVCSSQEYSSTRESTPRDCEERWELREIIRMNSRDSRDTLDSTDQEDGDYIHERESSVSSSHSQSSQRNSNTLPHQKNSSTSSDHRGEMKSPPNRTFYLSSDSGPWATSSLPRGSSNITQMPAFHGYQDSVVSSGRGSLFDGRLETGDQYGSNSRGLDDSSYGTLEERHKKSGSRDSLDQYPHGGSRDWPEPNQPRRPPPPKEVAGWAESLSTSHKTYLTSSTENIYTSTASQQQQSSLSQHQFQQSAFSSQQHQQSAAPSSSQHQHQHSSSSSSSGPPHPACKPLLTSTGSDPQSSVQHGNYAQELLKQSQNTKYLLSQGHESSRKEGLNSANSSSVNLSDTSFSSGGSGQAGAMPQPGPHMDGKIYGTREDAVSRRRANTTSSQSQGGGKAHIPGRIAELSSVSPLSSEHSSPRSSHKNLSGMSSEESLSTRLRPGVTTKLIKSRATTNLQDDLMKLIDPDIAESDLAGIMTSQSKNRRLSGRLVRTMSDESLHSGKGSLMLERDIRDVLFTDRKPDSQTSREHFRQHRLSPRALPDDTSRVTVPDSTASLDWSSLVDVATKAIEGSPEDLKDRISSPVNSTISSASSSSNLNKSGEIKVPSLYRPKHDRPPDPPTASNPPVWRSVVANPQQRINDLEMKVAQLEEELAQERQESAALDGEVQRLRTENARLQEESQNAAAQLRRFTEWFFTTIDRQ